MTWLVTGGAGYIGAHVVRDLRAAGLDVVVLDDLSSGSADRLPDGVDLVVGSITDPDAVDRALSAAGPVTGLIHFAARKRVDESVSRPLYYWRENVEGLRTVLERAYAGGVRQVVFSSSAAVYGQPDLPPGTLVVEGTPCNPINPYGWTKLAGEVMVDEFCAAAGDLTAVSLRYFNVAGAGSPELGDQGAFNLIPLVFGALDRGEPPAVFGGDYPTPDGTCIRDYIHVADLSRAHVAAAQRIAEGALTGHTALNIGTGQGSSVLEVLAAVQQASGRDTTPRIVQRRAGDPAALVADPTRANELIGWRAEHGLAEIVASAWSAGPGR